MLLIYRGLCCEM